jgi:hypothetical protein
MARKKFRKSPPKDEIAEESVDLSPDAPEMDSPEPEVSEAEAAEKEVTESEASEPDEPRKSQWNIYVVMLLIAFLFLSAGCLLLWTELNRYGFNWRPVG